MVRDTINVKLNRKVGMAERLRNIWFYPNPGNSPPIVFTVLLNETLLYSG